MNANVHCAGVKIPSCSLYLISRDDFLQILIKIKIETANTPLLDGDKVKGCNYLKSHIQSQQNDVVMLKCY